MKRRPGLERSIESRLKVARRKLRCCSGVPLLLTLLEASRALEARPNELEQMVAEGRVQTSRGGGAVLISRAEVERLWLEVFSRR